jgi:hypothetical protein
MRPGTAITRQPTSLKSVCFCELCSSLRVSLAPSHNDFLNGLPLFFPLKYVMQLLMYPLRVFSVLPCSDRLSWFLLSPTTFSLQRVGSSLPRHMTVRRRFDSSSHSRTLPKIIPIVLNNIYLDKLKYTV